MLRLISHCLRVHIAVILVVGTAKIQVAHSQISSQDNSQPFGISARAAAFAGAYVAEAYDVSVMYWNPAALMFVRRSSVVANIYYKQTADVMSENVAVPLPSRREEMLAIGATVSHGANIKQVSSNPRFTQFGLDLGYARAVNSAFSLGIRVGVHQDWSRTSFSLIVSTSAGLYYSPSPEISYGVAVHGIGSGIRYTSDSSSSAFGSTLDLEDLARSVQVGARLRFPSASKRPRVNVALASEKLFDQDDLEYRGGIEIFPVGFLALRVGYIMQASKEAATYGVGVRTERFRIDYAISPSHRIGRFHQVSLSFALKNESYGTRR